MAVVKEGQGPYAPTSAVMAVINGFRFKHPRTPFDVENIQLLGVSESLAPRTLQALRLLDLVDEDGEPTSAMVALREADSADFPERLAEVVRAAYGEVFAYCDPATQSPDALRGVFRFYRPPSQHDRMLRLFYGLCEEAKIITEAPTVEGDKSKGSPSQRATRVPKRPGNAANNGARLQDARQMPPSPSLPSHELPEIVAALVSRLPKKGEPWTQPDAEWWLEMAAMAFPKEYGYETEQKESG